MWQFGMIKVVSENEVQYPQSTWSFCDFGYLMVSPSFAGLFAIGLWSSSVILEYVWNLGRCPNPIMLYMSYHTTSYHIIQHHTTSYHIISYHIIPYYILSCHIRQYHIISYHVMSHHIISYNSSYHSSYHVISYHIKSCM